MSWTISYIHSTTIDSEWWVIDEYQIAPNCGPKGELKGSFEPKEFTLIDALKLVAHHQKRDADSGEVYSYRLQNTVTGQNIII